MNFGAWIRSPWDDRWELVSVVDLPPVWRVAKPMEFVPSLVSGVAYLSDPGQRVETADLRLRRLVFGGCGWDLQEWAVYFADDDNMAASELAFMLHFTSLLEFIDRRVRMPMVFDPRDAESIGLQGLATMEKVEFLRLWALRIAVAHYGAGPADGTPVLDDATWQLAEAEREWARRTR